jgi:hypothetical protein
MNYRHDHSVVLNMWLDADLNSTQIGDDQAAALECDLIEGTVLLCPLAQQLEQL